MSSVVRRIAAFVAVPGLIAGCSSGSPSDPARSTESAPRIHYGGPAIPGLTPVPIWRMQGMGKVEALGFGTSIAVLSQSQQGYQLAVLEGSSGKTLGRAELVVPDAATGTVEEPALFRDNYQGRPVVVLRYTEKVLASGTQAEHDQRSDIVLDAAGRQVWRSPQDGTGRTGKFFVGGYIASGNTNTRGSFPDPASHPEQQLAAVTSLRAVSGGAEIRTGVSAYSNDVLYAISNDKAVMQAEDRYGLSAGIKVTDLPKGGKVLWKNERAEFLTLIGPSVLTTTRDGVQLADLTTGHATGHATISEPTCNDSLIDQHARVALCAGRSTSGTLVLFDATTAKVLWQQDGPNARGLTPVAAVRGVAYLEAESPGSGRAPLFVAINDRTGQVLADNLQIQAVATTDNGYVLIEHDSLLYGFSARGIG
jgi:hypothetical protein